MSIKFNIAIGILTIEKKRLEADIKKIKEGVICMSEDTTPWYKFQIKEIDRTIDYLSKD